MENSCNQPFSRHLSSAAVIFERIELWPEEIAIHAVFVSDVKEEECMTYCQYEVVVTLSWATELDGGESKDLPRGDDEGPKSWCTG